MLYHNNIDNDNNAILAAMGAPTVLRLERASDFGARAPGQGDSRSSSSSSNNTNNSNTANNKNDNNSNNNNNDNTWINNSEVFRAAPGQGGPAPTARPAQRMRPAAAAGLKSLLFFRNLRKVVYPIIHVKNHSRGRRPVDAVARRSDPDRNGQLRISEAWLMSALTYPGSTSAGTFRASPNAAGASATGHTDIATPAAAATATAMATPTTTVNVCVVVLVVIFPVLFIC